MKNYHTHTKRCMHATGNEEEYILNAIQTGYTVLGFSDHTPWHYNSSFVSHMRMREEELEDYVNTLRQLKEKYKNQIKILIGLECEYFPGYMDWLNETIQKYKLDYIILGNHYDDTDETGIYFGSIIGDKELRKYVDNCIKGLETGLYSYIAHPDLANHIDIHSEYYYTQMKRLCDKCKGLDIPVEFNLLGFISKRNYPNDVFFQIAKEVENKVIIGVDAHTSGSLATKEYYDQALLYLDSLGLEVVDEIKLLNEE